MKKIAAFLLVVSMLLSLVSCGAALAETKEEPTAAETAAETEEETVDTSLRAGFAREIITPDFPVPLAGYGRTSSRFHQNVLDDITVSCVALSEGGTTALLITQDIVRCNEDVTSQARRVIAQKTGVPFENILVASTHTHSSVDPSSEEEAVELWKANIYYKKIVLACEEAIADLYPAALKIGRTGTKDLTYVRRYFLKDGTFIGDNSGTSATEENPVVRHEAEADEELQLIRFVRRARRDIVLVNWQGHASKTGGSSKYDLSADYIAPFRETVESKNGVYCAFFLGSSGNQNTTSRIKGEKNYSNYITYGQKLAGYADDVLKNGMEPVESRGLLVEHRVYAGTSRIGDPALLDKAGEVKKLWDAGKTSAARKLCKEYGFSSPYAANYVVNSQSYPATVDFECCAVSVGDVSFVSAGYEMFSTIQLAIKEKTPFKMTFVLTCCQAANGYMPTADVFPNGGYEVDTTRFVRGTAEELRDTYLDMLNDLYNAR